MPRLVRSRNERAIEAGELLNATVLITRHVGIAPPIRVLPLRGLNFAASEYRGGGGKGVVNASLN
jgi:hypothetical protein